MLTIIIDREPSSNYATPGYNPPEYKTQFDENGDIYSVIYISLYILIFSYNSFKILK